MCYNGKIGAVVSDCLLCTLGDNGMKKKVELEQLEKNYWDYAVAQMPDGTFRVRNPYQKRLPQGLVLCLPAEMEVSKDGGYLNPARFLPDRTDTLAYELGLVHFNGISTHVMFCDLREEDGEKLITPVDPLTANCVAVRSHWNLEMSAGCTGLEHLSEQEALDGYLSIDYEWHDADLDQLAGWDFLLIRLKAEDAESARKWFSAELQRMSELHDAAARQYEAGKDVVREQYRELKDRARTVGWKLDFDKNDDYVLMTYQDDRGGLHTIQYRYRQAYLEAFMARLSEREAWYDAH